MGLKFWTVLIWVNAKAYSNNSCFLSQGTFIAMVRVIAWLWQEPWHGDGRLIAWLWQELWDRG